MADIGKPLREIQVNPAQLPIPQKVPAPLPAQPKVPALTP